MVPTHSMVCLLPDVPTILGESVDNWLNENGTRSTLMVCNHIVPHLCTKLCIMHALCYALVHN